MQRFARLHRLAAGLAVLTLAACGATPQQQPTRDADGFVLSPSERNINERDDATQPGIFGEGGLNILGGSGNQPGVGQGGGGIGVNSFLWRASLDSLAFMPLASADPFGGVILTEWYSPPGTPNERFKVTVYILDRRLRADGLRTSVFRQVRPNPQAVWQDAQVRPETSTELEDAILTRARQLRIATGTFE